MTDRDLLALAERCEKATGPDRELELAIWRALNPIHAKIADERGQVPLEWLHCYTASLDDAWRQMIRHFGGDDEALLGPRHDDLLTESAK